MVSSFEQPSPKLHKEQPLLDQMKNETISSYTIMDDLSPVFYFVGAFHCINVHSDLELDVAGQFCGPGVHVHEDQTCPKLILPQQVQSLIGHQILIHVTHKLIQTYALWGNEK